MNIVIYFVRIIFKEKGQILARKICPFISINSFPQLTPEVYPHTPKYQWQLRALIQ